MKGSINMTRARDVIPPPQRRLLSAAEAAAYCGAPSVVKWRAACPVVAVRIYPGNDGLRYDRTKLDDWIDRTSNEPDVYDEIGELLDNAEAQRRAGRGTKAISQRR